MAWYRGTTEDRRFYKLLAISMVVSFVFGATLPLVDLPLPDVFSGTTAPFLAPVVADRTTSGGGNVSYVPIPFRKGCEITLVGGETAKVWFQVTARLVDDPEGIR